MAGRGKKTDTRSRGGRGQGSVPALSDSWCRAVEGEGVDWRGRGDCGRQRGTCWLTLKVSRTSTAGLRRKERVNAASESANLFNRWEMDLN